MKPHLITIPEELSATEKFKILVRERKLSSTVTALLAAYLQTKNGSEEVERIAQVAELEMKKKAAAAQMAAAEKQLEAIKKKEKEERDRYVIIDGNQKTPRLPMGQTNR